MDSVFAITRYTFLQQIRNRLYLVVILFAVILMAAGLLFGALAADQELRVILNLGLSTMEFFGLVAACFGAVTLVLEEMESRTIYLILSRPFPRYYYILGRCLGLTAAVVASIALMGILHWGLLLLKGWETDLKFFLCFPYLFFKVMIMAALALFFSLFSSSSVASIVFTFFFWILGHFGSELEFMAQKSSVSGVVHGVKVILFAIPDLQYLNYKDLFHIPNFPWSQMVWSLGYTALYSSACLILSAVLFSKKEL